MPTRWRESPGVQKSEDGFLSHPRSFDHLVGAGEHQRSTVFRGSTVFRSRGTCHTTRVTRHMSRGTCHAAHVTRHMSRGTCHDYSAAGTFSISAGTTSSMAPRQPTCVKSKMTP